MNRTPRIALVHDWLTGMRGGEKCLEVLCELFPHAPIYTLLHVKGAMSPLIESKEIRTSFVQHLPSIEQHYRSYLPLFPFAIESFDFSGYDILISSSHCVAKGAIPRGDALHLCYCHTPMRYVWDQYDEYFGVGRAGLVTRSAMSIVAPMLRRWDVRTAHRVHHYIANSENVRGRIQRIFHRDAVVIYPPVDTERFRISSDDKGYYLIVSALVPYKKIDLAIDSFNASGKKLIIVGRGPDEGRLRRMAKPNIQFVGWKSDDDLASLYAGCRALIFPGEEDFGIVPLEAMASGKPVIAYGKGGALETVQDGISGVFFYEQTVGGLEDAVHRAASIRFDPLRINNRAMQFSRSLFKKNLKTYIEDKVDRHAKGSPDGSPDS